LLIFHNSCTKGIRIRGIGLSFQALGSALGHLRVFLANFLKPMTTALGCIGASAEQESAEDKLKPAK